MLYAVFGIIVFNCSLADILLYWLPAYLIQDIVLRLMSRQAVSAKWSGIYETSLMPHMLGPILKESVGISLSQFMVTDKNGKTGNREREVRLMVPFLILIALSIAGIVQTIFGMRKTGFINAMIILFWLIRNLYFYIMSLFLIDGRDSDGEPVNVIDAEFASLKVRNKGRMELVDPSEHKKDAGSDIITYEGISSRMNEHSVKIYLDERGLKIGDFVDISLTGETASADMYGVVIACRQLRHSEGTMVTVEIIDYGESELEYMQILYDRIPTLPQSLTLRDFGIISHMWYNILMRLIRK